MGLINQTCKVAIIGAGSMAPEHIKAFAAVPGVEIAGIYNRSVDKAQALAEQYNIPIVAASISDLYEKTKADLVVIAVYETAMLEVATAAMQHLWTVFIEKPPGYFLKQAQSLADTASQKGTELLVGLNRRFLSSTQTALKSLNEIDAPRFINVFDQQSLEVARQFNHHEDVIRYWMYANSIHLVDYLMTFGRGDVVDVRVLDKWDPATTRLMRAAITFASGDEASYQAVWNQPGPWAVAVTTPDIRWELRPLEKAQFQPKGQHRLQETPLHEWDTVFKPGFRLQAEHAVNAAIGHASASPRIADALKTMALIAKIYGL